MRPPATGSNSGVPILRIAAMAVALALLAAACSDTGAGTAAGSSSGNASSSTTRSAGSSDDGSAGVSSPNVIGIATPDGEMLAATVNSAPDSPVAVVLAHMRGADRSTWNPLVGPLNDAGYATVAFDFRGYGASTGTRDTHLDVDLAAAVNRARADGASKVILVGASMGGTAVLEGGSRLGADGVVAISAPASFLGLDGGAGAAALNGPTLLIDSADDHPYVDELIAIEAATDSSLVTFDGSAHGTAIFASHGEELVSLIVDFVGRTVSASGGG